MKIVFDQQRVEALFAHLKQSDLPGVAVGIAVGGKPIYRRGFGLASLELPVVLSSSMRMRIFSTSKHFTCFAFLLLCEEGLASIEDPLGKFLPELHPVARVVTMRQLMSNVSGLRDAHDIRWQFSGFSNPVSTDELISLYRTLNDVNFAPGTAWRYNNGGFALLSAAIEQICEVPLEEVLRKRVFEPVGLHDTLLRRYDTDFVPNSATMHMTAPNGGFDRSYLAGALAGEGGIVSTVDDLLRWLAHMRTPTIGSAQTWQLMLSPQILANGTASGYGLSLSLSTYRGVSVVHHAGGGRGGNSQMIKVLDPDMDVVVMSNRQDVVSGLLADQIIDTCVDGLEPRKKTRGVSTLSGNFRSPSTGRIVQVADRSDLPSNIGAQRIVVMDGTEVAFSADESGMLQPDGLASGMKWSIKPLPAATPLGSIEFDDYGEVDRLTLMRTSADTNPQQSMAGCYISGATGTQATVSVDGTLGSLETRGRFGSMEYQMTHVGEGVWRVHSPAAPSLGGMLTFREHDAAFEYSTYCNSRLLFRKARG
jgi:CubicO group peptidase (beta-lactamase class C family)